MYGAILGDIIGSPYEFAVENAEQNFPLFCQDSLFTDDTVMTIAVGDALKTALKQGRIGDEAYVKCLLKKRMRFLGKKYPDVGYGGRFEEWIFDRRMGPYNSCGNGSAMRVSTVGWLFNDMETVKRMARWTAEVTHNHPEGIKGAEAVASAIYMGRKRCSKKRIKNYIEKNYQYDLEKHCDDIKGTIDDEVICQTTVPAAIIAFLDGKDFEDVVRKAVLLRGDCDTVACIAGSLAEAYYGIPEYLIQECKDRLPEDLLEKETAIYDYIVEVK